MKYIYRLFEKQKWLLYTVMAVSTVGLAAIASQIEFEEDVSKLFASIDSDDDMAFAFSDVKVKDNVFVLVSRTDKFQDDEYTQVEACEMFVNSLLDMDSIDNDIESVTSTFDFSELQGVLEYAKNNLPAFIDIAAIDRIDSIITPENIALQMEHNLELIVSDASPFAFDMVRYDPVGIRYEIMKNMEGKEALPVRFIDGHLFTSDSTTILALCTPNFSSMDSKSGTRLFNKMNEAKKMVEQQYPGIEILYHGAPIQSVNNANRIKSDLVLTVGISMIFICIIIALCFKSIKSLLLLIAPVGFGALFSLAVMFLLQGKISLMALGIGAIVVGVAMSYSLHLLTHYKYVNDPLSVLESEYRPIMLAGITTIGAFLGLLFTGSSLLGDFGLFASFAVVGTILACLLFVPHFLKFENRGHSFAVIEKFNSIRLDRINPLIILLISLTIVCIVASKNVKFDSDLTHIGYQSEELIRSKQMFKDKVSGGSHSQYYAVLSENLDSALILNRQLSSTCNSLQSMGLIESFSKTGQLLVDSATQIQRIAEWKRRFSPERCAQIERMVKAEGARYGFDNAMFEPFFGVLRADYTPSSVYDSGVLQKQILDNLVEKSGDRYMVFTSVRLDKGNLKSVNDFMAKQPGVIVLDPFYYTGNLVQTMSDDFNMILAFSSMFVLVVLFLSLKNIFLALIAFLPMSISWYIVLGVMSLFDLQFNLINIIISTFIFGIGVDYSIFVMEGLIAESTGKDNSLLAIHKTAITLSATLLLLCMASLLFAVHPAISSIGISALVGVVSTIVMSYCIQPFIFRLFCQTRIGVSVIDKIKMKDRI